MTITLRIPRRGLPRAGLAVSGVAVVTAVAVAALWAPPSVNATDEPAIEEAASPSLAAAPRDAFALAPAVGEVRPTAAAGHREWQEPATSQQEEQEGEGQQQQQQATAQGGLDPTMSAEEEAAMRLIRQILEEEEGVRMGQDFTYDQGGRRDPFRSLLQQAAAQVAVPQVRPPGLPGFLISEVEIKVIAEYQGGWAAMLLAPDQQAYFAEVGTELYDGHIKMIRSNEVVFEQTVSDLLGARRTREVVKRLRDIGGGSESRP